MTTQFTDMAGSGDHYINDAGEFFLIEHNADGTMKRGADGELVLTPDTNLTTIVVGGETYIDFGNTGMVDIGANFEGMTLADVQVLASGGSFTYEENEYGSILSGVRPPSTLAEQDRRNVITAFITQAVIPLNTDDTQIISDFMTHGTHGIITGSYGDMPDAHKLYEVLGETPPQEIAYMLTLVMDRNLRYQDNEYQI